MRAAKVIGLGTLFSLIGFVAWIVISVMSGSVTVETGHATGLSAVVGGIIEMLFSPITWLVVVVAFGAAFLVVRELPKAVQKQSRHI
jgi:hypothetical protein